MKFSAAQAMIEALALAGRLSTLDTMHCQKNIYGAPQSKQSSACSTQGHPGRFIAQGQGNRRTHHTIDAA